MSDISDSPTRVAVRAMRMLITVLCAAFVAVTAAAAEEPPEALVRKFTAEVLEAIQRDEALQAGDRQKALALAEEKILPHVNFREMTRLASGRAWNSASAAQRDGLVSAFRAMLVRTYANAIDVYRGQTMQVVPVRMPPGATEVTVRNRYLSSGKPAIPVDYRMWQTAGGWKIYDIAVDGVSLVLTYRSEFEEEVRRTGVDGLIQKLGSKNSSALRPR